MRQKLAVSPPLTVLTRCTCPKLHAEELREAGVQLASAAAAKRVKVDGQIADTQRTEPRGSHTPTGQGSQAPMSAEAAYDFAQKEWQTANPGRRFDKTAEAKILGRVVQLQLSRLSSRALFDLRSGRYAPRLPAIEHQWVKKRFQQRAARITPGATAIN